MIHKDKAIKKGIKIIDSKETHNPLFENLKANFPQTIKDNQVDLKAIATLLGLDTKANIQGYELTFTGKALANALYSTPSQKTLKLEETFTYHNLESCKHSKESNNAENKEDSNAEAVEMRNCGFQGMSERVTLESNDRVNDAESAISHSNATQDNAQNFIIKGDNLDVLKILKSAYSEKIKMIYIDPPYNTKNDNFIYPDNFRKDYKAILQEVGLLEIDDEGNEIESETLQFFKNIQSTRTHSGWLSFMLPRLKLARDLLREDGVIFISIDDNEQANLKILCDEIFGEENFVAQISWRQFHSVKNDAKNFSKNIEYILCYAKSFMENIIQNEVFDKADSYKKNDNDGKGFYKLDPVWAKSGTNTETYAFKNGKQWSPPSGTFWRYSLDTIKQMETNNEIVFDGKNPMAKRFLNNVSIGRKSSTFWDGKEVGFTLNGDLEVKNIFNGNKIFENPKPIGLLKRICEISTKSDDIILDFFAGSGTTAQAVMELNKEDGGNRKFILVQIDEPIKDDKKSKAAYDFCKNELKSQNPVISDITIERVKRASIKIANENFSGFSVLRLSDKPELITDEKGALKLLDSTISPRDKALNLALQSGKTLDKPLKPIFENKLYACEDCLYLVACDKEVLEYLRNTQNEYIFIDAFSDISLENFLNLDSSLNERLRVVY